MYEVVDDVINKPKDQKTRKSVLIWWNSVKYMVARCDCYVIPAMKFHKDDLMTIHERKPDGSES